MSDTLTLDSALHAWFAGKSISGDVLNKFPIVWFARIGQTMQFIGGLTIIIDIIKMRFDINDAIDRVERLVDLKKVLTELPKDFKNLFLYSYYLLGRNPKRNLPELRKFRLIFLCYTSFFLLSFVYLILSDDIETEQIVWSILVFAGYVLTAFLLFRFIRIAFIVLFIWFYIFFPFLSIVLLIYRLFLLAFLELLVFWPVRKYLEFSKNEGSFKLGSFLLVFAGFLLSLFAT